MKWGVWGANFSPADYSRMIHDCLEAGVTTFDHADIYGHYTVEAEFGAALKDEPSLRKQMQIISKCGINLVTPNRPEYRIKHYNTSAQHIEQSVGNSLRALNTDYLDILLLHRPDPLMNPHEVAEVFTRLKKSGKVQAFGVSNFNPSQTELLHSFFPITVNQVELSIVKLSPFTDGTLDHCQLKHLIPMAWSPLGGGNFFDEEDERNKRIRAVAGFLGEIYDISVDQVLLAWLFRHPAGIKPVLGTIKKERIKRAMDAARVKFTNEEWFMLWRASTGKEVD
jgi:predicted oxidoreductase